MSARQVGMPYPITDGLLILGIALADTDPDQARACLRAVAHTLTEIADAVTHPTHERS